jgi:two-component system invasion response regulator UvrY
MIRVLLVDDHAVVRMGFRLLLQSLAEISVVAEAESGEAACQRYFELTPDVVVLDLAMPGMNGLTFRQEQLKDPQLAPIPVVVCSGTGTISERQTELMGIARFLRKPTDIKDLLGVFQQYGAAAHHE